MAKPAAGGPGRQGDGGTSPSTRAVSVLLPTYQAERYLPGCLQALGRQVYPGPVEIVVADGGSTDGTREIVCRAAGEGRDIRLVDNPGRLAGAGLNRAALAAKHDLLVRCDAQSRFPPHALAVLVAAHDRHPNACIGGRQVAVDPGTRLGAAVAAVYNTLLGSGAAAYRRSRRAGAAADTDVVDTVYLGSWDRDSLLASGGFSTEVGCNEDAEFNIRWRRDVGEIRLVPDLAIGYVPRASLPALARQYARYGFWRSRTVLLHRTFHLRQLAAAAPVLTVSAALVSRRRWPTVGLAGYGGVLAVASTVVPVAPDVRPLVPVALATMHLAWGLGFLTGLVATARRPQGSRTGRQPPRTPA